MKLITYGRIHDDFRGALLRLLQRADVVEAIQFERASGELERFLDSWNGDSDLSWNLIQYIPDTSGTRLLLCVSANSAYARWCKKDAPHAKWGGSNGAIAVEYAPSGYNLSTQLHETLHLFGVGECYEEDSNEHEPKSTCDLESCLMRYGKDSTEVCNHVLRQLHRSSA